jgi:hypothetical protein
VTVLAAGITKEEGVAPGTALPPEGSAEMNNSFFLNPGMEAAERFSAITSCHWLLAFNPEAA